MPKDFLAALPAGGGVCTRALAPDAEIRPKMAVVRKKPLRIRQLRAREQAQTIVLLLTRRCGIVDSDHA